MKKSVEKGITLIALVVTIVVLLILAGISISMLTGENGVITQARKSKEETIIGDEKEGISLAYSSCKADNMMEYVTASQLEERMKSDGKDVTVTQDGLDLKVRYHKTGHEYTVNQNGKIEDDNSSDPEDIIDVIYVGDYVILEKKSGEVLYVELDGNEGKINNENATVITKDGIAQKDKAGFFVDNKGKVYGWEYDDNYNEKFICISNKENSILKDKIIKKIYCMVDHFIALDEDGKVYTWGENHYGELGDGLTESRDMPVCISDIDGNELKNKKIVYISNSYSLSDDRDSKLRDAGTIIALDKDGKVYTWGYNEYGILGDGTTENRSLPKCISEIEESSLKAKNITSIYNEKGTIFAIDTEGKVHAWGYGYNGYLGDGTTKNNRTLPKCISDIENNELQNKIINSISRNVYYGTIYALDQNGNVYVWGNGSGNPEYIKTSNGNKIIFIDHGCILDSEGNIYDIEYDEEIQEGVLSPTSITSGKKITLALIGFGHNEFVLDSDGIGYLKTDSDGFQTINTKDEYRIIKVNNMEGEFGLSYITDKGDVYYRKLPRNLE